MISRPINMIKAYHLLVVLLCSVTAQASDWPSIEAPPKATVQWVGQDMKLNGVPLRIQQFTSNVGMTELMNYYRAIWGSQAERKSVENALGKWHVIGKQQGDYYLSVQVKPAGLTKSTGYLTVSKLPGTDHIIRSGGQFPLMAGTRIQSELESNDPGQKAKTLTLLNTYSVTSNADFYKDKLAAQGWILDPHYGGSQQDGKAYALFFRLENEEATLILSKVAAGTLTVANIVTYQ